jgi:outer membrane protein assembly factor BamB
MKRKLITIFILITAAFLRSGCASGTGVASSWPGIAVDGETVYLAYNQHVFAIDLEDGTEDWRYPGQQDNKIAFYAPPTVAPDGQVVVGAYNNILYSLNPSETVQVEGEIFTVREKWTFNGATNRYIGGALAHEAGIFAPSADNTLYALDLNGKVRWQFSTEEPLWARPATDENCSCIYLPSMDHHIYALNAETGELIWKSVDLGGSVVGTPTLSPEGVLYVGSFGSRMTAINAQDGTFYWSEPLPTSGWVWSGPLLHEGRLYFGDLEGTFYVVDAATGKILNERQIGSPIPEAPVLGKDAVYFTAEAGVLYAVDLEGNPLWERQILGDNGRESKLFTSPVVAGDRILVAPMNIGQVLVALDLNGNRLWDFTPEN